MVKQKKILENCTGFEWDQGNLTKNWDQHDVSSGECEQIFFNRPLIIKRDKEHSKNENRYYVLGRTNVNRLLFAVFTVRNDKIRIISARDMTDAEIERYLK
ncbi:MAG: BrnT family toxin [Desulfobacterales bacterium]|nr:BrnT family toxin [Desulfobacterales bacterium]